PPSAPSERGPRDLEVMRGSSRQAREIPARGAHRNGRLEPVPGAAAIAVHSRRVVPGRRALSHRRHPLESWRRTLRFVRPTSWVHRSASNLQFLNVDVRARAARWPAPSVPHVAGRRAFRPGTPVRLTLDVLASDHDHTEGELRFGGTEARLEGTECRLLLLQVAL